MTEVKTYTSKANAVRAFRSKCQVADGMTSEQIVTAGYVDEDEPGKWVLNMPEVCRGEDEFEAGVAAELAERKRIADEAEAARIAEEERVEREHPMTRVVAVGPATGPRADEAPKPKTARAKSGSSNGLKIEKDRDTQNGVTRPSAGGKCRGIWDALDGLGTDTTAKTARDTLIPQGFDRTTIMVQFYKWRKFNGIEGRQA